MSLVHSENKVLDKSLSENTKNQDKTLQIDNKEDISLKDKHKIVYFIITLIGLTMLTPFNTVLGLSEFWAYFFGSLHVSVIIWLTSVPNFALVLFVALLTQRFSHTRLLITCFSTQCVVALLMIIVSFFIKTPFVSYTNGVTSGFIIIVTSIHCLVFVTSFSFAIGQGTAYAFSAIFPPKYIKALSTGTSISGLIKMLFWLFVKFIFDYQKHPFYAILLFIFYDALLLAGAIICLFMLEKIPFSSFYIEKSKQNVSERFNAKRMFREIFKVFPNVKEMILLIFFLFFTTFLIYPVMTTSLTSSSVSLQKYWAVILLIIFAFFDVIGRLVADANFSFVSKYVSDIKIKWWVISRAIMTIIIMILWFSHNKYFGESNVWTGIHIDIIVTVIISYIAFSLGLFCNKILEYTRLKLKDSRDCEIGLLTATFSLVSGIFFANIVVVGISKTK